MLSQNQKKRVKLKVESEGFASFWKSLRKNALEANSPSRLNLIVELIDYAVSLEPKQAHSQKPLSNKKPNNKPRQNTNVDQNEDEPMRLFTMMNQKKD